MTLPCSVAVLSHEGRFAEGVRVLTVALEGVTLLVTLVAARCVCTLFRIATLVVVFALLVNRMASSNRTQPDGNDQPNSVQSG